nr:type II toxin-antitoxin system RelE/ParE family toxin [uncultured Halomonas sp.]
MLLVKWQPQAREALWAILDYLGDRNHYAAEALQSTIEETTEALPQHPYLYRPGRVSGTREAVVHPNYLVIYRVAMDHIAIVDVLHARQKYP